MNIYKNVFFYCNLQVNYLNVLLYHSQKIVNSFKLNMPFDLVDLLAQYKDSCLLATLLSTSRLDLIFSENAALQRFLEALEDLRDEELI